MPPVEDPPIPGGSGRSLPIVPPMGESDEELAAVSGAAQPGKSSDWKVVALKTAAFGGPPVAGTVGFFAGSQDVLGVIREVATAVQGPFGALVFLVVCCSVLLWRLVVSEQHRATDNAEWRGVVALQAREHRVRIRELTTDKDSLHKEKDTQVDGLYRQQVDFMRQLLDAMRDDE